MNATLKAKHEELEALRIRTRKILDEHKTAIPPEEMKALDTIKDRADVLRDEIKNETDREAKVADLAGLSDFLDSPVYKIPHGANPDDDSRKSLQRSGWEFKAGMAYKMTSIGVAVEMFNEGVVTGEIPEDIKRDPVAGEFYRVTRAAMGDDYKTAYVHLIKATARYGASALSMLSGVEQKALSEGTDTAGGFIVPPDIQAEMLARIPQTAIMRNLCRVQPTNRDTLRWPAVAPNSTSSLASIYSSGFVGGWVGETPAFSDTDPAFKLFDITVKKIRAATKLSNDFVSDAAVNVLAFMAKNGAENMALVEDAGFLTGDGSSLQPMGLLNVPGISTFDVEGSTSNLVINTTAAAGSAPKIRAGFYKLPVQYRSQSAWAMCSSIRGKVDALVDGVGRPIWPAFAAAGLAGPTPDQIMGRPTYHSDWIPDDGTDANKVLILGDFSQYIIAQRTQITSLVLRERFADTEQVGIILFERVGGSAYNTDAFRFGIV